MNHPRDLFAITEPAMLHTRREDGGINSVLRTIDWKWLLGIVGVVCIWGANQWVQYNSLIDSTKNQTAAIQKLTTTIELQTSHLATLDSDNLKQDFAISRLKERVDALDAWRSSTVLRAFPR